MGDISGYRRYMILSSIDTTLMSTWNINVTVIIIIIVISYLSRHTVSTQYFREPSNKSKIYTLIISRVKVHVTWDHANWVYTEQNYELCYLRCLFGFCWLIAYQFMHDRRRYFGSEYSNTAPVWGNDASMSSPDHNPITQPITHTPHQGWINTYTVIALFKNMHRTGEQIVAYVFTSSTASCMWVFV